jgi:hypothetical protein
MALELLVSLPLASLHRLPIQTEFNGTDIN